MNPRRICTPLDEPTVRSLELGQHVLLSGSIFTARDAAHHRIAAGQPPPIPLAGAVIYHCGPVITGQAPGWRCLAAGPTTSLREEPYEHLLIRRYGLRAVLGKGGMGPQTAAACAAAGAVYLHAVGGAAVIYADRISAVTGVDWLDLGAPEAIWHLQVIEFPAIVTIDARGGSLHAEVLADSQQRLDKLLQGP